MPLFWLLFLVLVVVLLVLDLSVFHRKPQAVRLREAAVLSSIWISLGLAFSGIIYLGYQHHWLGIGLHEGSARALGPGQVTLQYLTGYVLEKSLSVDNIFVIALLFATFKVEPQYRHRILYWGILGAIVLRGIMILGGAWLIARFDWLFYVFGLYLAYTGIKLLKPAPEAEDPDLDRFTRWVGKLVPLAKKEHGGRFFATEDGRWVVTRLGLALLAIEGTDVIFALDSIPAVFAVTTDPFIVFTSNIFAILGLRSLYFILSSMLEQFQHLKVALAFILVFIGGKMLLHDLFLLNEMVSLAVIGGALAVGILSSILTASSKTNTAPP